MLDVMQGAVPGDADCAPPAESFAAAASREPARLRVAASRKLPAGMLARLSDDQRFAFDRTARLLGELGHHVVEQDPPYRLSALEFTQTWIRGIYEDFAKLPPGAPTERSTRQLATAGRILVPPRRRAQLRHAAGSDDVADARPLEPG